MKKSDIILALSAGIGTAIVFGGIINDLQTDRILGIDPQLINQFLFFVLPLLAVFGLWVSFVIGKKLAFVPQAAKFLMVGVLATLIDVYVFKGLELVSGLETAFTMATFKAISFATATFVKYWANKFLAFEKEEMKGAAKELAQFFLVTLIAMGINVVVFSFLVKIWTPQFGVALSSWKTISVILSGTAITVINFLGYKFIVFKK